ncbi:hypothetical protein E3N88_08976 [Mikania micrantha]|uniref:non-specific serine/threonine protein kinase n=1 Tax=Mikania micrantha TaxID=192012 RepID=A0A5N6PHR4_9ASTR|nr:hypothetical protein E3N88_08976 [Mikania micrantha]
MKRKGKYSKWSFFSSPTSPNQAPNSMVKLQQLLGSIRVPKTQKRTPKTAGMRSIYRRLEIRVLGLENDMGLDKSVEFYEEFLDEELLYKKLVCKLIAKSLAPYVAGVCRSKKAEISSELATQGLSVLTSGLEVITVDKAVEFSYEELSTATNDFSLANKIGQGGFGSVYYAELRGQKAAIKKMDMRASKEFLAELRVLTRVHHLNLVCLLGYCVKGSHFLVYEYVENGNLSHHLHGSGPSERDPLPWSIRVQIALDSARGLEYIHEYTVPIFIHCDIKSDNILIDKNFNGKVADFGLTRLTEVGSRSRVLGTFGYMPPEYAQYGEVSPKVDVYAFGVVLYELISAKKAIIRANDAAGEPKGLISLFDEFLSQANPKDELVKMIDPRLGDNYPLDSVMKMAQLAKSCTNVDPQQRPSMRSIVVALMNLSSSSEK